MTERKKIRLIPWWAALAALFSGSFLAANHTLTSQDASRLIATAVSIHKFGGAPIENVLLADPEKKDGILRYRGEFNVAKGAKKISCEDWVFSLERHNGLWGVTDIVRGRCND